MKFVFYTNSVSPHQLPLARELVSVLGVDNYRYVALGHLPRERIDCGWKEADEGWIVYGRYGDGIVDNLLLECDILLTGVRDFDLIEARLKCGKATLYCSERWFKPKKYGLGWLRFLSPKFLSYVFKIRRLSRKYDAFKVLPIGTYAWNDMIKIGVPKDKMLLWGYFVAKGTRCAKRKYAKIKNILCVGRLIPLKRFDTVIKALCMLSEDSWRLSIIGDGPMMKELRQMSLGLPIRFTGSLPIEEVRKEMNSSDALVFSSEASDGWGAVVSEAMEEGLTVFATAETGSGSTIVPARNRFHAGDCFALSRLLREFIKNPDTFSCSLGEWTVESAARKILEISL